MKRRIALALVLIMLFALVLPQTALAVTRYYLTVSITDKTYTVTGTTGYLSLTDDSLMKSMPAAKVNSRSSARQL